MQVLKSMLQFTCVGSTVFIEITTWRRADQKTEVQVREGKLKNRKTAGKDEVTGEMIKGGSHMDMEAVQYGL